MKNTSDHQALRNPSASEMPALLADLSSSGQSIAAFARARGLKSQNLYLARRRLAAKRAAPVRFDPVRVVSRNQEAAPFELQLSNGNKLVVPADFETSAVRRLIELLGAC